VRNLLLITAMLFSLAAAATAADQKKNDAQPQSQTQAELTQMVRNNLDGPASYASSTQSNCESAARPAPAKRRCENSEGDPQASQNHVEYNGT